MLGLNRYIVDVSDPNPEWASEYEVIAAQIRRATNGIELELEHIGSTSVPNLVAKPVIDVGILLPDELQFNELVAALSSINLIYRGEKGAVGGRMFVRESAPEFRTHHIHVYFKGAPEWDRYLIFRDNLRANATLREEYSALKRKLAVQYRDDRIAYTDAKFEFVNRVLNVR